MFPYNRNIAVDTLLYSVSKLHILKVYLCPKNFIFKLILCLMEEVYNLFRNYCICGLVFFYDKEFLGKHVYKTQFLVDFFKT